MEETNRRRLSVSSFISALRSLSDASHPLVLSAFRRRIEKILDSPVSDRGFRFFTDNGLLSLVSAYRRQLATDDALRGKLIARLEADPHFQDSFFLLIEHVADHPDIRAACLRLVDNPEMRQIALVCLASKLPADSQVQQLIQQYWHDADPSIRRAVRKGAATLACENLLWRDRILESLQSSNDAERLESVQCVGECELIERDRAVRAATLGLLLHDDSTIASAAMQALSRLLPRDLEVQEAVLPFLASRQQRLRQEATQRLGPLARTQVEIKSVLMLRLLDPSRTIRHSALSSLAPLALEDADLRLEFVERLDRRDGCGASARISTVAPLVAVDVQVRARIIQFVKDSDPETSIAAIKALESCSFEDAFVAETLRERLDDRDLAVQAAVISALQSQSPHKGALREKLLELAATGSAALQTGAVEALAPQFSRPDVRRILLARLEECSELGNAAATAIATLAAGDPDVLRKVRELATAAHTLPEPQLSCAFTILEKFIEHDEHLLNCVFSWMTDPRLGSRAFHLLCRHSRNRVVAAWLLTLLNRPACYVSRRAICALAPVMAENPVVRRGLLEMLSDLDSFTLLGPLEFLKPLVMDDEVREHLLHAVRVKQGSATVTGMRLLSVLAEYVGTFPSVEKLFREAFEKPLSPDRGGLVYTREAVLGLASLMDRDPGLRGTLLPWLGVRTPPEDPSGAEFRRKLADYFAPITRTDTALLREFLGMSNSPAWQSRQGAAWTLISAGVHKDDDVREQLRGLLDDDRAEESWTERLHAATALLNHPLPSLSRQAVGVVTEALTYGTDLWYEPLGSETRAQAAQALGKLQPFHRHPQLTQLVARTLERERTENVRGPLYHALLQLAAAPDPASA